MVKQGILMPNIISEFFSKSIPKLFRLISLSHLSLAHPLKMEMDFVNQAPTGTLGISDIIKLIPSRSQPYEANWKLEMMTGMNVRL